MSIYLKHFPEFRLDVGVYFGRVTAEEVIRTFDKLDPVSNWLCYFDTSTNLSGIDIADFPAMRQAVAAKEAAPVGPKLCALVNLSGPNELYVQFWSHYATAGLKGAHERREFPTLEGAYKWLAPPPEARDAIDATIAEALARPAKAGDERRGAVSGFAPN